MAVQSLVQADEDSFDQLVLGDPSPVLVEFFSPWCAHCRRLAPTLEELARDYHGRVRFVQVNAEDAAELALRYQVQGVPTMVLFVDGREMGRIIGAVPKEQIAARLDRVLAPARERG